ncbi:hypothetical protein HMPREF3293_01638 [Christensenella minuta]|uniref:Uncharacterized protein n=1 Tax=Christensenella minuta TaxID=626937 RepID=A0A136Q4E9_9FIRM|nr:hypothetical protein HMPREF3293_01638 [Christensenella minuta]
MFAHIIVCYNYFVLDIKFTLYYGNNGLKCLCKANFNLIYQYYYLFSKN